MGKRKNEYNRNGKSLVGFILLIAGSVLLLRSLDILFVPRWIFSWPAILICIGLFIGIRSNFRRPEPYFMLIIGSIFLAERIMPQLGLDRLFWPMLIIASGLWIILKPGRNFRGNANWNWDKRMDDATGSHTAAGPDDNDDNTYASAEDRIDAVCVFGGIKKNVVSKNFRGGDVVNFFGGTEINLMQADFSKKIKLDVVQVFGGTKIIMPANWVIHSEMVAIFGGIEDKRPPQVNAAADKVLIIEGTSIFGGIEFRSF